MTQETSNNRLYVLLVILSIAIVVIAAGFYSFIVAGTSGVKLFNITASTEQKWLSVSGSASAFVTPDTASVSLGVLTQAATAKEASEKNAASMNAVINALKNLGIQDKDMRTSFSIQPVYSYPKDGGTPTITAYRASNNVQITTKALEKLGDIVDKSVAAGANQVGDISFTLSEEKRKQIRNELLADAVKDAETKAGRLAESLKVRITGVRTSSISETGFPQPFQTAPLIAERATTPIQPGESMVTISIETTYNIE